MGRMDLDALQAEAGGELHGPYVLGGEEFWLPRIEDWPAEAVAMANEGEGRILEAFAMVMGEATYERFRAHRPTIRQFKAIFEDIEQAEGLGDQVGNSPASSQPSRSTPAPSRPTLPASTASV